MPGALFVQHSIFVPCDVPDSMLGVRGRVETRASATKYIK